MSILKDVGMVVVKSATKVGNLMNQYSPEICIVAGIVGGGLTVGLACKATLKSKEVKDFVEESKDYIDDVLNEIKEGNIPSEKYNEDDARDDIKKLYSHQIRENIKIWSPVTVVGIGSAVSILCGYGIIKKRNAAIVAAYEVLDISFKKYRKRVVDELGEEADHRFFTGTGIKKIKREVEDEDGNVVKKKVDTVVMDDGPNGYAILFDKNLGSIYNTNNLMINLNFLKMREDDANRILNIEGVLLLNDVYKMLGASPTEAGAVVGWRKDGDGDGFVKFDIQKIWDEDEKKYNSILVDFNVDGIVYNALGNGGREHDV